jgi:putative alpha-1,2-mannosidase
LNGSPYSKNYFAHEDLLRGATIDITMSDTPNMIRGIQKTDAPYSFSSKEK